MLQRFCGLIGLLGLLAGAASAQLTFSANYGVQTRPNSVAVGNLKTAAIKNEDMVVANYLSGTVTVLLNKRDGTGTFLAGTNYTVGTNPREVVVADFNGDGLKDIAAANVNGGGVSVLLNKTGSPGTFHPATSFPAGTLPYNLAVGDFNEDHVPDLVVLNENSGYTVLLGHNVGGHGNGAFDTQPSVLVSGRSLTSVVVGHFTTGTHLDLAIADASGHVVVLQGNGNGTFGLPVVIASTPRPFAIVTGHLQGNALVDDLAFTDYGGNVYVTLQMAPGTFSAPAMLPVGDIPESLAVGDFNKDGILDLVVGNAFDADITILQGVGGGTFMVGATIPTGTLPSSIGVGNFRPGDSHSDVAVSNFGNANVSVFFGH